MEQQQEDPLWREKEENQVRFETELEFVQSLANPFFLQSLAQRSYFQSPSFLEYLKYLSYWHKPHYAKFIQYPHALHHLALLNNDNGLFREALSVDLNLPQVLAGKQLAHWSTYREDQARISVANGNENGEEGPAARQKSAF